MAAPTLTPGQTLGHFRVLENIGAGAFGDVYRAWDTRLERNVAIKVLNESALSNDTARKRLRREALILGRLNHPNIESIYDFHSENGIDYLVVEYIPGASLIEGSGTAGSEKQLLDLSIQLARGLAAAHAQRVLHRDLKPSNLRITPDHVLKILDFGLAQLFVLPEDDTLSIDRLEASPQHPWAGTPAYLSPEQVDGKEPDTRSDIYSAGVVMYELATGSRAFPQSGESLKEAILSSLPPAPRLKNKGISHRFQNVILKCLEKDPKLRYQSANELLGALQEAATVSASNRSLAVRLTSVARLRPTLIAAVLLAVLILAIGIMYPKRVLEWIEVIPPGTTLAVLPLQNRTGDPALDYLAAGISEALTNDLSRMPDLQVTAESVARRYGGSGVDLRAAGRELHVQSVVQGAIANQDGAITVSIELIDVGKGRQKWGRIYESSLSRIADLQHQISTDVAYRLKLASDVNLDARLKRQYSTNPSTYDLYLRGRFHLAQRTAPALQEAINEFQRAIDRDPRYAPAHAGLADGYSLLAYYGLQEPIPLLRNAMASAQRALDLDSTLGEAYTSRALARTFLNFDWQGAEDDYKRAIELYPNYLTAHTWYGLLLLMPLGRRSEAAAQIEYARASDPDSLVTTVSLATLNYLNGDYDRSIELIQPRLQRLASFEPVLQVLALDYLAKNRNADVIVLLEGTSLPQDVVQQRAVPLGIAYARTGQKAKAAEQLKIAANAREGSFLSYEIAGLYTALKDHQRALDMLELAYARRESNIAFLNVDPLLAPLHSEPRFKELLKRMNMSLP